MLEVYYKSSLKKFFSSTLCSGLLPDVSWRVVPSDQTYFDSQLIRRIDVTERVIDFSW